MYGPSRTAGVLRLHRRAWPTLPIEVFGPTWGPVDITAAEAAALPGRLCSGTVTRQRVGPNRPARDGRRRRRAGLNSPHLWTGVVGDSGDGKSPGADCLLREVLPEIERRMIADYPDRLREWRASFEFGKAAAERWRNEVRDAEKKGAPQLHCPQWRRPDRAPIAAAAAK